MLGKNKSVTITTTDRRIAIIEELAEWRGLSREAYIIQTVWDRVMETLSRTGAAECRHCFCRPGVESDSGLARCCWCDLWGDVRLTGTPFAGAGVQTKG